VELIRDGVDLFLHLDRHLAVVVQDYASGPISFSF